VLDFVATPPFYITVVLSCVKEAILAIYRKFCAPAPSTRHFFAVRPHLHIRCEKASEVRGVLFLEFLIEKFWVWENFTTCSIFGARLLYSIPTHGKCFFGSVVFTEPIFLKDIVVVILGRRRGGAGFSDQITSDGNYW
jgi:hypothetical protein